MHTSRNKNLILEVRDFKLMEALGRHKSLTRAAEVLSLTQSALSHQLRRLEDQLSVKLFERIGKSLVPTSEGLTLIQRSRELLDDLNDLQANLMQGRTDDRIRLKISASCSTYYSWLARIIGEFTAQNQHINIEISHKGREEELTALANGDVDLVISSYIPKSKKFVASPLFEIDVIALLSETHPLAAAIKKTGALSWEDIAQEKLLIHDLPEADEKKLRIAISGTDRMKNAQGTTLDIQRINLTEAIVEIARRQQGVGIIGKSIDGNSFDLTGLIEVMPQPIYRRPLWCIWKKNHDHLEDLETLCAHIRLT